MIPRKVILATSILAAGATFLATGARADGSWRQKSIDETQAREAAAIEQGRYKGEITRREYRELLAEQARIANLERQAKADGYVSRREFREIRDAQASADSHIKSETGDGQVSLWRRWLYRNRY